MLPLQNPGESVFHILATFAYIIPLIQLTIIETGNKCCCEATK